MSFIGISSVLGEHGGTWQTARRSSERKQLSIQPLVLCVRRPALLEPGRTRSYFPSRAQSICYPTHRISRSAHPTRHHSAIAMHLPWQTRDLWYRHVLHGAMASRMAIPPTALKESHKMIDSSLLYPPPPSPNLLFFLHLSRNSNNAARS